jgi:hypothetical protein
MAWRALALSAVTLGMAAAAAPPDPSFTLGILRRDGILLPFAAFNGKSWDTPWPGSDLAVPLPIAIDDVPKKWWGAVGPGAPWTAWILGEATLTPRPLVVRKPEQIHVFCGGRLALGTDYRGGAVDAREPTAPKHGLAIAAAPGTVTLEPIVEVSVLSRDARQIVETIRTEFDEQESRAAKHFTQWQHPYSDDERKEYPIQLEAFYRAAESNARGTWHTSYVEAVRRFPAVDPSDKDCGVITFVRGWVNEQPGKKPVINIGALVTYCDRDNVSFMLPFGRLAVGGDSYWVYQTSSWRDEFYSVARVRPEEVRPVVAVVGGSCPKGPFRRQ